MLPQKWQHAIETGLRMYSAEPQPAGVVLK
jgi:hypothetical protein